MARGIDKSNVSASRANYLQKMWDNGLRPIIYLVDGRVWPTVEACSEDIGYSTNLIIHECLLEDGYFAFFPEYFWGRWNTAGASNQYYNELRNIDLGMLWEVNRTIIRKPIQLKSIPGPEDNIDEVPGPDDLELEERERRGIPVLDQTTWTLYPSISSCARELGVSRGKIYRALSKDGMVRGHKLIL